MFQNTGVAHWCMIWISYFAVFATQVSATNGSAIIEWSKSVSTPDRFETGIAAIETSDHGSVTVSESFDQFSSERWTLICRHNTDGDTIWTRLFPMSRFEHPRDIIELPTGGYIVVGYSDSAGYDHSCISLSRVSPNGDLAWNKRLVSGPWVKIYSVVMGIDGYLYAAGYGNLSGTGSYRIVVAKFNQNGVISWVRQVGDESYRANSIIQDKNNLFAIGGSVGLTTCLFVRIDTAASLVLASEFDAVAHPTESICNVERTADGGYAMFGYCGGYLPLLVRLDSNLAKSWSSVGQNECLREPHSLGTLAHEGGYLQLAGRQLPNTSWSWQLQKSSKAGTFAWAMDLDSTSDNHLFDITKTSDSGYLLFGWTMTEQSVTSDPWLIKVHSTNNTPLTPLLVFPFSNQIVAVNPPALAVTNLFDADLDTVRISFEVYQDTLMSSIVFEEASLDSLWVPGVALDENSIFWWRARASDGYEFSEWSPFSRFTVNSLAEAPTAPQLTLPPMPDGKPVFSLLPTLSWVASNDPDPGDTLRYRVEISFSPGFSFSFGKDSLLEPSLTLTDSLAFGTHYWWRVTAKGNDGLFTTSAVNDFWTWKLGDINHSHGVDLSDLSLLIAYLTQTPRPNISPKLVADLTGDCKIDLSDLSRLVAYLTTGGVEFEVGCE